jgi:hypothetical protein
MKHIFPLALELCTLALIIITLSTRDKTMAETFVNVFVNLSSGSPYDLFNGRSPNLSAHESFGSLTYVSFA